jgi:hypothetical protein
MEGDDKLTFKKLNSADPGQPGGLLKVNKAKLLSLGALYVFL